jgi:ATP-dependent helicase Lhr and Lhr-like helicase
VSPRRRANHPATDPLAPFSEATRTWFADAFEGPTRAQELGWAAISGAKHALIHAPTGSGKTLAAFLWCLDRLMTEAPPAKPTVRVLYVSPLKALTYDVERNLRAPLAGIRRTADRLGVTVPEIRVGSRTGDTPADARRQLVKAPPDILVTTPESLYLLLTSQAREILRGVEHVIVDEVHAIAATKRGSHLALSLERLSTCADADPASASACPPPSGRCRPSRPSSAARTAPSRSSTPAHERSSTSR